MFPHLILQISAFFNDHVLFDVAHVLNGGVEMKKTYICVKAEYCALNDIMLHILLFQT